MRTARGRFAVPNADRDRRDRVANPEPDTVALADPLPYSDDPADLRRAHALQPRVVGRLPAGEDPGSS